jgi:hypothetical protein
MEDLGKIFGEFVNYGNCFVTPNLAFEVHWGILSRKGVKKEKGPVFFSFFSLFRPTLRKPQPKRRQKRKESGLFSLLSPLSANLSGTARLKNLARHGYQVVKIVTDLRHLPDTPR